VVVIAIGMRLFFDRRLIMADKTAEMKHCPQCGKDKEPAEFELINADHGIRRDTCRDCRDAVQEWADDAYGAWVHQNAAHLERWLEERECEDSCCGVVAL
jgi:hypothetical protein